MSAFDHPRANGQFVILGILIVELIDTLAQIAYGRSYRCVFIERFQWFSVWLQRGEYSLGVVCEQSVLLHFEPAFVCACTCFLGSAEIFTDMKKVQ